MSPEADLLSPEVRARVREVGTADIVVGIPSYQSARTIGHVVRAVAAGLSKYFGDARGVIVNSDGGSTDGTTQEVARAVTDVDLDAILVQHPRRPIASIVTPYHGIPGKGSAFRTIFQIAADLKASACAVVDADLRSVTPEWVHLIVEPVLHRGFAYVAPLYARHKYDGTITNSIVYPLTRALYGKRVRQPIGGDFGFSGALAAEFLTHDVWDTEVAQFGIDIWMTTTAIVSGAPVGQVYLGAKIHDPKDPGSDLAGMMAQVLGSLCRLSLLHADRWMAVRGSDAVPTMGFRYAVGVDPVAVNVERMIAGFRQGMRDLADVWSRMLAPETLEGLAPLATARAPHFRVPDALWARVLYDVLVAYKAAAIHRPHLLRAMVPLYLARVASFVLETASSDAGEAEAAIEALCTTCEATKEYLVGRWRETA